MRERKAAVTQSDLVTLSTGMGGYPRDQFERFLSCSVHFAFISFHFPFVLHSFPVDFLQEVVCSNRSCGVPSQAVAIISLYTFPFIHFADSSLYVASMSFHVPSMLH